MEDPETQTEQNEIDLTNIVQNMITAHVDYFFIFLSQSSCETRSLYGTFAEFSISSQTSRFNFRVRVYYKKNTKQIWDSNVM